MLKYTGLKSASILKSSLIYSPYQAISRPINYSFSSVPPQNPQSQSDSKLSFMQKYFGPQTVKASPNFKNRWLMVIPAFMTHFCIGSPWAWSLMAGFLKKLFLTK